ncbi:MAG: bacterioferritin [Pseudobacteriovorax sp.]|nr:bacterioferritin [Pseudobacteriovorax sp.]
MKGSVKVIEALNDVLKGELTAINQYFLHARICKDWGYDKIADFVYHESIDEMKHAQVVIDRILFLEGLPNLQDLGHLRIGQTVKEQLENDLQFEVEAIDRLKSAIKVCFDEVDHASREILEKILADEEHHMDWIETQLSLMKDLGETAYLAEQIHGS